MAIHADTVGYENLALVGSSQVSFQNRDQLIWTCHCGCCCGTKFHTECFGLFAVAFCTIAYTAAVISISIRDDKFVYLAALDRARLAIRITDTKVLEDGVMSSCSVFSAVLVPPESSSFSFSTSVDAGIAPIANDVERSRTITTTRTIGATRR